MITIDLRAYHPDVAARKLWQALFDLYRGNGCPYDHMDNMLIDLSRCKDAVRISKEKGTTQFLWGCDSGFYGTQFKQESQIDGHGPEFAGILMGMDYDLVVHCVMTRGKAVISTITKE